MPQITPNRTNHLRQDATFRGGSMPGAELKAIARSNRRKKRKLINRARAALRDPDLKAAATALVSVKRRWAKVGSAGAEHDGKLKREFEGIYEAFRARYEGVLVRAIARTAKAGSAGGTNGGDTSNGHMTQPYADLGTARSREPQNTQTSGNAPTSTELSAGPKAESPIAKPFHPKGGKSTATQPSQTTPTVAPNPAIGSGAGRREKRGAPKPPPPQTPPPR